MKSNRGAKGGTLRMTVKNVCPSVRDPRYTLSVKTDDENRISARFTRPKTLLYKSN